MVKLSGLRFAAAVTIATLFLATVAFAATPHSLVAKVDRVADGDSVTATTNDGTRLRIRLLGIDAPEVANGAKPGQPFGEEARDYLDHLIGGKVVHVDAYGAHQYKRVLAVLWDDRANVNLLMVAMGYAEMYRGAACQAYCQELEQAEMRARNYRVGMWAQGTTYESPAAFRKRMQVRESKRPSASADRSCLFERLNWLGPSERQFGAKARFC
jgi:endonuclease YncB( thermonuclease family)